jgi:hypothetical protein
MSLARLVKVEDIRIRGNLVDVPDVNETIAQASRMVTQRLANQLRTEFDEVTGKVDLIAFGIEHLIPPDDRIELGLSRGFVYEAPDPDTDPDVLVAETIDPVTGELVVVELDDFVIDYEKGRLVWIEPGIFPGRIQITYKAGFAQEEDPPYTDVYTGIPNWLEEAALTWSLTTYDWLVSEKREKSSWVDKLEWGMVITHNRYMPAAAKPM